MRRPTSRRRGFDDRGLDALIEAAKADGRPRNHQEIAAAAGVTDGRIQQIIQSALRKLRHPSILRQLLD